MFQLESKGRKGLMSLLQGLFFQDLLSRLGHCKTGWKLHKIQNWGTDNWDFFLSHAASFNFLYIGVELINYVVLVSGVQQSDSGLHIHVSILFHILFPYRSLQGIEQSSLCCTVGPCWLSILNIAVCTCQSQTPHLSLSLPTLPPLVTINSFSKSVSLFLFCN